MGCIPAKSCTAALEQATALWPRRSKASDGICGDASHGTTSDHYRGEAFDLTHDPADGVDCAQLADLLKNRPDRRVKYIIFNRRIWNPSTSPNWRTYSGTNPHTAHMHVSIKTESRNDTSPWWTGKVPPLPPQEEAPVAQTIKHPTNGYVVLQSLDGGVFTYDGAPFFGSLPSVGVNAKAVGLAWTPDGNGYWILGADGAIFSFGNAAYKGGFNALDAATKGNRVPVGVVAKGNGYVIITLDSSNDGSPYDSYGFET